MFGNKDWSIITAGNTAAWAKWLADANLGAIAISIVLSLFFVTAILLVLQRMRAARSHSRRTTATSISGSNTNKTKNTTTPISKTKLPLSTHKQHPKNQPLPSLHIRKQQDLLA